MSWSRSTKSCSWSESSNWNIRRDWTNSLPWSGARRNWNTSRSLTRTEWSVSSEQKTIIKILCLPRSIINFKLQPFSLQVPKKLLYNCLWLLFWLKIWHWNILPINGNISLIKIILAMEQQLEVKVTALEACRARVHELEHIIMANEDLILFQKKAVNMLNEQRFEKLEVKFFLILIWKAIR